jgi:predicted secreted protein
MGFLLYSGYIVGVIALFIGLVWWLATYLQLRLSIRQQSKNHVHTPPNGLTPAEIGFLENVRPLQTLVTALLIDLAVRGYIGIEQTKPKTLLKESSFTFYLLKDYSHLKKPYEKQLLDFLFGGRQGKVSLAELDNDLAHGLLVKVYNALKEQFSIKGVYTVPPRQKQSKGLWLGYLIIFGLACAIVFIHYLFPVYGVGWIFAIVAVAVAAKLIRSPRFSSKGLKVVGTVQDFRLFLLGNASAKKPSPDLFSKYLSYAVVLGAGKQWAGQFAGVTFDGDGHWYAYLDQNGTADSIATFMVGDFAEAIKAKFSSV